MKTMYIKAIFEKPVEQLIDANLDRAREGIRVVEEWCRFAIQDENLVITLKDFRHQLANHHDFSYKSARCTSNDKGIGLTHPFQRDRYSPEELVSANCARVQEALRVIEEFARNPDPSLAKTASKIRYKLYEIEVDILKKIYESQRKKRLQDCNLYLLTEPQTNLKERVIKSLKAGIKMVQYRNKEGCDKERYQQAKEISLACRDFEALFIVNDRIDIAIAVNADGVHLGDKDLPTKTARELLGKDKIIGRSTHSISEIQKAEKEGCDYLAIGPVNSTTSKPLASPIGLEVLKEASITTNLPLFAIGSINQKNIEEVLANGIKRCAVISAIMHAKDSFEATKKLLEIVK